MSAAYQNLFDYMYDEYGVILLQNEIQEIVRRVKLDEEQDNCNLPHVIKAVCDLGLMHNNCSIHEEHRGGCNDCIYNKQTDL